MWKVQNTDKGIKEHLNKWGNTPCSCLALKDLILLRFRFFQLDLHTQYNPNQNLRLFFRYTQF